jgi:hypothetical protein
MSKPEVERIEAHAKRKILGLPNDIRSKSSSKNINNKYLEVTPDLVQRLSGAIDLKVTKLPFALTGMDQKKSVHNRVYVKKPLINLLVCLSCYLTVPQYGHCNSVKCTRDSTNFMTAICSVVWDSLQSLRGRRDGLCELFEIKQFVILNGLELFNQMISSLEASGSYEKMKKVG